jgi:DNA-binding LacI/PurR family transcriptional regulator
MRKQEAQSDHSVTALDVAKAAGVSQSTVSRVLNNKDGGFISTSTRNRVLKTARELGYVPNPSAQALRRGKTNLIGIILREIDDPVFALLASHLSIQLRGLGYHLILINAHSDPREALEMNSVLNTRHADGLIIMGDLLNGQKELQQLVSLNRAVVSLFRKPFPGIGSVVTVDNYRGIELALNHLFELGHEKIGFLGYDWLDDTELRQEAFHRIMKASGKQVNAAWIQIGKGGIEGGYVTMKAILSLADRPSAVVASDDQMAIGAISAATELGMKVPDDVSIVGFDDIALASHIHPPLTTVRMPVEAISARVCKLLLESINSHGVSRSKLYRVMPRLVIRKSTTKAGMAKLHARSKKKPRR